MSQPIWGTDAGSLGTYPTGKRLNIKLIAMPAPPAANVRFRLISGTLPSGTVNDPIVISPDGYITGTLDNLVLETSFTFTVRVNDELTNFGDRTFSLTVVGDNSPSLSLSSQELLNTVDSVYVNYDLPFKNPTTTGVFFSISSGTLPPGLHLSSSGKISGYPQPPALPNNSPAKLSYQFTVQLYSSLGVDVQSYTITVRNHRLTQPKNTRKPVVLNYQPLTYPVSKTDTFFDYYLIDGNTIPDINAGEYFSFKVLGYDFDNMKIAYTYSGLPPGLTGDVNTGWITGVPQTSEQSLLKYDLSVTVSKANKRAVMSEVHKFTLRVASNIKQDVVWLTNADLGSVNNGTISNLYVKATSALDLRYKINTGTIPPNLKFLPTGEIAGRISYQPTTTELKKGDRTEYEFEVLAFSPKFPLVRSTRTFKLTVYQYYETPLETIYIKASSSLEGRKVVKTLLEDESLIPTSSLYRSDDVYFGKSSSVSFVQAYGVPTANIDQYTSAMNRNHFIHHVLLSPFTTAVARDVNNNIIYEVIYSQIYDSQVNDQGQSPPQEIIWDRNIPLNEGAWTINNSTIHVSFNNYNTNLSPGSIRYLNPSSTINMRNQIISALGQDTDVNLLPKWMTSQQLDGNTIGYIPAWVVCYTLPGKSQEILDNINQNWAHSVNEIDFTIDRYIVDKSATYNWNSYLSLPTWSELPSASPTPTPVESKDMVVLFPRTTILPKNIDY